jgi:hypothetical protein
MKKIAAIGLIAALAFAPLAAFAQTATPDAGPTPSMSAADKSPTTMMKKKHIMRHMMHKHMMKKHMMHKHMMKKHMMEPTPAATEAPKS